MLLVRLYLALYPLYSKVVMQSLFGCCGFHLTNLWISGYRSFVNTYASVMTQGHIEVNPYIFLRRICCFLSRDFSSQ